MKRRFTTVMVMLLAFALLISATAISASAETTYSPIGGSTSFVKNLVVDSDANIPNVSFTYSIRRGTAIPATESTIEILTSDTGGGPIQQALSPVFRQTLITLTRPQARSMFRNRSLSPYPTLLSQSPAYTDTRSLRQTAICPA